MINITRTLSVDLPNGVQFDVSKLSEDNIKILRSSLMDIAAIHMNMDNPISTPLPKLIDGAIWLLKVSKPVGMVLAGIAAAYDLTFALFPRSDCAIVMILANEYQVFQELFAHDLYPEAWGETA